MIRWPTMIAPMAAALMLPAQGQPAPVTVGFEDLTDDFDRYATETAALPTVERVARFRVRFARRAGGFYELRDREPARYDSRVASALAAWPAQRGAVLGVARDFDVAFTRGLAKFRRAFPDFRGRAPVYLVHSLGEMEAARATMARARCYFSVPT